MAEAVSYKQYNKRDRRAVLETDFSKGMMSTEGTVEEGYVKSLVNLTFEKESNALTPRPGLDVSKIVFVDSSDDTDDPLLGSNVTMKAARECVEQGVTYYQDLLGSMESDSQTKGTLWLCTHTVEEEATDVEYSDSFTDTIDFSKMDVRAEAHKAYYFIAGNSSIHNVPLLDDVFRRIEIPVGCFAFSNSYYFFGEDDLGNPGLFRTAFNTDHYEFEAVTPKHPSVSEAVTYGYNMLRKDEAYTFENSFGSPVLQLTGILPYEVDTNQTRLMLTPKKNQPLDLVCYFDGTRDKKYDFVWEWREVSASDWTFLQRTTETLDDNTKLLYPYFQPPASEIMVRVSAYPYTDLEGNATNIPSEDVEKAMVVGFDFTVENYGTALASEQKVYDLTTSTGMAFWNGRLACWGVPEDPTILFLSDYNEPAYFPYPNNIVVFDEPIIYAVEFMGSLAVFTTDKLYSVVLADDGNSFQSTVLQSHLHINPWDRHLIQTVRNMLYFKSGNYYYMMVPKAQSTTGELALAPITTPITSFFDHFSVNIQNLLRSTYRFTGEYDLLTYYNFLDYDDIHNVYVYAFNESESVLNVDIIYNTSDRTWKVWMYESSNFLYPYRQDATQPGQLATTSLIEVEDLSDGSKTNRRIIQVFKWNKLTVMDFHLPFNLNVSYISSEDLPTFDPDSRLINSNAIFIRYENESLYLNPPFSWYDENNESIHLLGESDLYAGFNKQDFVQLLKLIYKTPGEYFRFMNNQFLDTGYRNDELHLKKRYRELQLQINNLDKDKLSFGMEYLLDGAPRKLLYKYDVLQTIDEFDPEYGVVYVETTPYLEVDPEEIDLSNQWTIDSGLNPEVSLWKVRVSISGKGSAPRFKLYSENQKRFELLGINWISKIMHMR